jgi:hypothetical protein
LPHQTRIGQGAVPNVRFQSMTLHERVEIVAGMRGVQLAGEHHGTEDLRLKLDAGAPEFGTQKAEIEARVVRDENPPRQSSRQIVGDILEARRRFHDVVRNTVVQARVLGRACARIDQRRPFGTVGTVDRDHPDFGNAVGAGRQAGRFEVNKGEAV